MIDMVLIFFFLRAIGSFMFIRLGLCEPALCISSKYDTNWDSYCGEYVEMGFCKRKA